MPSEATNERPPQGEAVYSGRLSDLPALDPGKAASVLTTKPPIVPPSAVAAGGCLPPLLWCACRLSGLVAQYVPLPPGGLMIAAMWPLEARTNCTEPPSSCGTRQAESESTM